MHDIDVRHPALLAEELAQMRKDLDGNALTTMRDEMAALSQMNSLVGLLTGFGQYETREAERARQIIAQVNVPIATRAKNVCDLIQQLEDTRAWPMSERGTAELTY